MIARFAIPFFLTMGLVVAPLLVWLICRLALPRKYRRWCFLACTLLIWGVMWYGTHPGFDELQVHHIEFASPDLPETFDGYRIVQFSDAHVGTLTGSRLSLLQSSIDSINAQQGDMIVFTGDMQNILPDELPPLTSYFQQLHAPDGVYAILGNHDYAVYQTGTDAEKASNCKKTVQSLRDMRFDLLLNEHRVIRRDSDSLVIAGMENWGNVERMPRLGDVGKTLAGVSDSAFVVLLQHDPSCWRDCILPQCKAQLTLSGHTHGGQFSLFGWAPVSLRYSEWGGTTYEGSRAIHVSTGIGSLIPFRLGMPREIVVITLRRIEK